MQHHKYRIRGIQGVLGGGPLVEGDTCELVLGVDVAKRSVVGVVARRDDGEALTTFRCKQPEEIGLLVELVRQLRSSGHGLFAVMEPTGTYGDALRYQLGQAGIEVRMASAQAVSQLAVFFDGVPSKHDAKDAAILAWMGAQGKIQPWPTPSDDRIALRALLERRDIYEKPRQRALHKLEAKLARHFPEADDLFALERQKSTVELLAAFPSPTHIAKHEAEVRALLLRTSRGQVAAEPILRGAAATVGEPLTDAEAETIRALAQEVARARAACDRIDVDIAGIVGRQASWTALTELLGAVTVAALVAYLGDVSGYSSRQLLKATGLGLREHSSGTMAGQKHITKQGPSIVRHYLHFTALRLIYNFPVVRAWYQARGRYRSGQKRAATVAVMRKLVSALPSIARGERFDCNKLFCVERLTVTGEAPTRRTIRASLLTPKGDAIEAGH